MEEDFCEPTQPVAAFGDENFALDEDDDEDTDEAEPIQQDDNEGSNQKRSSVQPAKVPRLSDASTTETTPFIAPKKRAFSSFLAEKLQRVKLSPDVHPNSNGSQHTRVPVSAGTLPTTSVPTVSPAVLAVRVKALGTEALPADISRASFAPDNEFVPQELVLVPRAEEKFIYGRVMAVESGIVEILLTQTPPLKKWLPPLTVGKMRTAKMMTLVNRPQEILHTITLLKEYLKDGDLKPDRHMTPKLRHTCLYIMASQSELLNDYYESKLLELQHLKVEMEESMNITPPSKSLPPTVISKVRFMRKRALELVQFTTALDDELTQQVLGIDCINIID
eukprot:Protomagalhaensia_sp_Gyna_25__5144@NODE_601_length_3038_cov_30_126709_g464_i0_p1_GENE_NODE_601_length_3038_cov_30_126709_g464_i0NODE_601_length_3038_cov_30_126709_g464_i0_p1_ORF_typecomplete_len335_score65_73_NODE_601_length_3038_cov_30_126709_g464_i011512155